MYPVYALLTKTLHTILPVLGSNFTNSFMDMIYTLVRSLMPNGIVTDDDLGVLYRKDVVCEPLHVRGLGTESLITPAIAV